ELSLRAGRGGGEDPCWRFGLVGGEESLAGASGSSEERDPSLALRARQRRGILRWRFGLAREQRRKQRRWSEGVGEGALTLPSPSRGEGLCAGSARWRLKGAARGGWGGEGEGTTCCAPTRGNPSLALRARARYHFVIGVAVFLRSVVTMRRRSVWEMGLEM